MKRAQTPPRRLADRRPFETLPEADIQEVISAIWWEVQDMRAHIHRANRTGAQECDVVLAFGDVEFSNRGRRLGRRVTGLHVDGSCPCRDYVLDAVVDAERFLAGHGEGLRNPAGAVRKHIRMHFQSDWIRRRRTAAGAQARVDRLRNSSYSRQLPDEFHRAVLRHIVDEAGSAGQLAGPDQLHRRIAERVVAEFGGEVESELEAVRSALSTIELVCRTGNSFDPGDGTRITWWERYVERPLGRRPVPTIDVDSVVGSLVERPGLNPDDALSESDEDIVDSVLSAPAEDPAESLPRTIMDLARSGTIRQDIAEAFLRDQHRVEEAVTTAALLLEKRNGSDARSTSSYNGVLRRRVNGAR